MKNKLLIGICAFCLLWILFRFGEFIYDRIPPYDEGQCLTLKADPLLQVKIIKNWRFEGFSVIEIGALLLKERTKASFSELRSINFDKTECIDDE